MAWNLFTNTGSQKTGSPTLSTMPAGVIMAYAGTTAPLGFLFCDGSAVSRTGYASLYTAISGTFGIGDGSTTFNLPDLRGRTIIGLGTNASVNALALSDGVAVANRRPQHRHTPHQHTPASGGSFFTNGSAPAANVTAGGGQYQLDPNTNLKDGGSGVATDSLDSPAFLVTNYIISTTTVAPVVASTTNAYGGSIASGSSIVVTGNSTYLLTGTTALSTVTGGVTGNLLTILASGQATGVCVVLNNGTTSNALSLRDSANFGIYAGESVTFMYNGTYWVETSRNVKTVLSYAEITSNVSITAISEATANSVVSASAITFDGATPILMEFFSAYATPGGATSLYGIWKDGSTSLGYAAANISGSTTYIPWYARRRLTPTNASHTYSITAFVGSGTGTIAANVAGTGTPPPAFIQISRAI